MKLTDWQKNIIIGTVLGGSSLVKVKGGTNHFLSMRNQRIDWLKYKTEELGDLFGDKILQDGKTFRCQSKCSAELSTIYDQFYRDGKRYICEANLDVLMDIGMAIWFLDGGSTTGRNNKNAYFSTSRFGEDGSEIIRSYFSDICDMQCSIQKNSGRLRVLFSVTGTESLFSTIAHRFPTWMLASGNSPA
jgi:hypothetical protein